MKRPNITPGPWASIADEPQTERDICHFPHSGLIVKTIGPKPDLPRQIEHNEAHARAIAALPDLLEALEFVLGNCDPNDERHLIPKECRSAVVRALTKAGYTF